MSLVCCVVKLIAVSLLVCTKMDCDSKCRRGVCYAFRFTDIAPVEYCDSKCYRGVCYAVRFTDVAPVELMNLRGSVDNVELTYCTHALLSIYTGISTGRK